MAKNTQKAGLVTESDDLANGCTAVARWVVESSKAKTRQRGKKTASLKKGDSWYQIPPASERVGKTRIPAYLQTQNLTETEEKLANDLARENGKKGRKAKKRVENAPSFISVGIGSAEAPRPAVGNYWCVCVGI